MKNLVINRKMLILVAFDLLLVTVAFLFFIWLKPASLRFYLPSYFKQFILFITIWFLASLIFGKYTYDKKIKLRDFLKPVLVSTLIVAGIITILIFGFHRFSYSRMIVLGTIGLSGFNDIILYTLFYYYRKLNRNSEKTNYLIEYLIRLEELAEEADSIKLSEPEYSEQYPVFTLEKYKEQIIEESSKTTYNFLSRHIDPVINRTLVFSTTTEFNIKAIPPDLSNVLINLKPINDFKRINKFFEAVNARLPLGGLFIDSVITNETVRDQILRMFPKGISKIVYSFYYFFKRLLPKLPLIKKFYFFLTNGYGRALSKAETLGRLYSCGFELLTEKSINDRLYFVARKISVPAYDMHPTYGPLISLKRIGKQGQPIHVLKFRTMHAYSEYIQEYVFEKNKLKIGGKLKNDFRISKTGQFMRKYWLDEIPMLFNWLIGDLKLVGVRPLSPHYFNLYTKELQDMRIRFKPGLIPPFYADMPKTLKEIMESEMRYLKAYEKNPVKTDFTYFWRAVNNIVVRNKRSA